WPGVAHIVSGSCRLLEYSHLPVPRANGAKACQRLRRTLRRNCPVVHLNLSSRIAMLQQQIHDGPRIQHPEWVKSDGERPSCDSYDSRLAELLSSLTQRGS